MLVYRVMRDDGTLLAYKIAMRQLDRVEKTLRTFRGKMVRMGVDTRENSDIIQVAINRAVNKKIQLVNSWWKEHPYAPGS